MYLKKKAYVKAFLGFGVLCIAAMAAFAQQGGLDTTFGTSGSGIFQDPLPSITDQTNIARYYGPIEVLANGQIIVAGSAIGKTPANDFFSDFIVRRLNPDGSADLNFGTDTTGSSQTTFYRWGAGQLQQTGIEQVVMAVQPADGKIVVAARCSGSGGGASPLGSDLCLMRYNQNGTLDTGFGGNSVTAYCGAGCQPQGYTMDPGKVWTYTGVDENLTTLNGNFNGIPVRIRFTPDGRIVVFGNSRDFTAPNHTQRSKGFVAVYSTGGSLQSMMSIFDPTGNPTDGFGQTKVNDADLLSDGSYLCVGSQARLVSTNPPVFTQPKWAIFHNTTTLFLDQINNNLPEGAFGLAQLRSNKILVGGGTSGAGATFVRYNGNLSLDTTFGNGGRLVPVCNGNFCFGGAYIGSLLAQPDGKVIGFGDPGNLFRINPDGSADRSFALYTGGPDNLNSRGILPNGRYHTPFPVRGGTDDRIFYTGFNYRPNGRLLVPGKTGVSGFGNPVAQADVLQLKTFFRNGGTFTDFNDDGEAEISVYRPSDGAWYQLDSFDGTFSAAAFGNATDKLAPADYDGDGKTDRAVFRDGTWYISQSSNGQLRSAQWGSAGDIPRPGDFNGDGQADIAVFRPSNGVWYILYSNPIQPGNVTYAITQFGQNGDIPVMADFDGDGKSDVGVYRNGAWYFLRSSNQSVGSVQFGTTGDVPVVGDYDADGKSDVAVFRNGTWYALRSSDSGLTSVSWGAAGDKPVPGDYDNDGKNDFAIYRNGVWWVLRTSDNGYGATSFGLASDLAVPAAYVQ